MKIEHEMKDVKILRYGTAALALASVYGKKQYEEEYRADFLQGLLTRDQWWVKNPNYEMLHAPLAWAYEGELVYTRTCALVSLQKEWLSADFYLALLAKGYVPAGTNEAVAYLRELKKHNIPSGSILHLGTRFLDGKYLEQKLVTKEDGGAQLAPFFGKLKPCYAIVVAKKEEKAPKK